MVDSAGFAWVHPYFRRSGALFELPGVKGRHLGFRRGKSDIVIGMELERSILRKVGDAISRFKMIRDGDYVAVGVSGGKDSLTLLEALLLLQKRAPINFRVSAFTVEQGKFLRPIHPIGEYLQSRGIDWVYIEDGASLDLLEQQPDHGCDVCSRFRRRAVYDIARKMGANVVALGHTADDFCEAFLRNSMFTGRISALPPVTWSKKREFRLIRPLVFVTEDQTSAFAESLGAPVIPCGCSQKTGTVRNTLRSFFSTIEKDHPYLKETLISAMGNVELSRLLDPRYLNVDEAAAELEPEVSRDTLIPLTV
jgi:tRNA 2-thiocytidine biosynthesis protein TtcA